MLTLVQVEYKQNCANSVCVDDAFITKFDGFRSIEYAVGKEEVVLGGHGFGCTQIYYPAIEFAQGHMTCGIKAYGHVD
jgi:hypothetical protein